MNLRTITLQVTEACQLSCQYCYQGSKTSKKMTTETAKKIIDMLFEMYERNDGDFINQEVDGLRFGFIGGEPLLGVDVIRFACEYFTQRCEVLDHPWGKNWRATFTTNGIKYFDIEVQDFIKEYNDHLDLFVSVDGPQEMHNSCRVFQNGEGSFQYAYEAMLHYAENYNNDLCVRVTLSPDNLSHLYSIAKFFIDAGLHNILTNVVNDAIWGEEHAGLYYRQLKEIADYLLESNKDIYISAFRRDLFVPSEDSDEENYCGVNGYMVAFDTGGMAYPCIRFMDSSLCGERREYCIGSAELGLMTSPNWKANMNAIRSVGRKTHSPEKCLQCKIACGCSWCVAWDYQLYGTLTDRCTYSCLMHQARSLANVYYWNKRQQKLVSRPGMDMNLPMEDAIRIVGEKEYKMLVGLISSRKDAQS